LSLPCLAVLVSTASADLLVSDRATNQILRYDLSGQFLEIVVDGDPSENGGLIAPSAMALGPDGELLVASVFGSVLRYDVESGAFLGQFATDLLGPSGLLYDAERDRVYVSTLGNFDSEEVFYYRGSTGDPLGSFGTGTGASGRTAMAIGPDQELYVGGFANDQFFSGSVLRFDAETLEADGTFAAAQELLGTNGMIFRPAGQPNTYTLDVVGLFSFNVVRFDTLMGQDGSLQVTGSEALISRLDFPSAILDLGDGTILVSNLGNDNPETGDLRPGSVGRYQADSGEFLETFLEPGGPGNLSQPTSLLLLADPLDCNGDGVVDQTDVDCLCASGQDLSAVLTTLGSLLGDADFDGEVGFSDFVALSNNYDSPGVYSQGDFDCDGVVGFADFVILSNEYGQSVFTAVAVPEPTAYGLVLLAIPAWWLCLRKRRLDRMAS
jgi:hypothetical protein